MQLKTECALILLAMIGLVGLPGCNDPVKAPPAGRGDLVLPENYPRIIATQGLDKFLAFSRPVITPTSPNQPMSVSAPVRSLHDRNELNIQYRYEWMDQRGQVLSDSGWRFAKLAPRVQTQLSGSARDVGATDWRLHVRSAR